jgi:hypothetical protein
MNKEHSSQKHLVLSYMRSMRMIFPKQLFLSYAFLGKAQSTDVAILKETAKTKSLYSIQPFTGGGKDKITHLLQWQDCGP